MTGFYLIRVFTERYFRTEYKYNFSLNVVLVVNFKSIQIFRKEIYVLNLKKYTPFLYKNQ